MCYGTKGMTWDSSFKLPSHDTSVCVPLSVTENCSSVALEEQLTFINIANNWWEGRGLKQLQKQVQLIFHDNQSCTSGGHALWFIALHPSCFMKPHSAHLVCYLFPSAKFKIFFQTWYCTLAGVLWFCQRRRRAERCDFSPKQASDRSAIVSSRRASRSK